MKGIATHPVYAVPDGYLLIADQQYGASTGLVRSVQFPEAAQYGTPLARDIAVDGKHYMAHVHYGGCYRFG